MVDRLARFERTAHPLAVLSVRARMQAMVVLIAAVGVPVVLAPSALSHNNAWVYMDEHGTHSDLAEAQRPNECEGTLGMPYALDPAWVRVGGSPDPATPFVEASGQVLQADHFGKGNPFVTHTDAPFNHSSKDINAFLTLDKDDRWLLSDGSFLEGDENEHGLLEVEWERGGIPLFAFPASMDRMTVWGPHIFDCGHGDAWVSHSYSDRYRTEIHPPVGWVLFRNTADSDGVPTGPHDPKATQTPWKWYEPSDRQGAGATLPSTGLVNTPAHATVADAFFSTYGGVAADSLNGCQDEDLESGGGAPCMPFRGTDWAQPVLQQDYTFFVPAPPRPADAVMVWESEDRCSEVPHNPANPPEDDVEDVGESEGNWSGVGAPTCNIPHFVVETEENGQPGIRVTVKAKSSGVSYPDDSYVAFAKRYKVSWDHVPPELQRTRRYKVRFTELRVYNDGDNCGTDGEWLQSYRVNEQWIHPVYWSTVDDDGRCPFTDGIEDEANQEYKRYDLDFSLTVDVVPGQPIHVWSRSYEIDHEHVDPAYNPNDLLPLISDYHFGPGTFVRGANNEEAEGSHRIVYTITDVTPPAPTPGTLSVGDPAYGPNSDTGGLPRVSGASALEVTGSDGERLQYRAWPETGAAGKAWQYDDATPLRIDVGSLPTGRYVVEYAPVSSAGIVAQRQRTTLEVDTTPPELAVPDDMVLDATSAEGRVVTYDVSATDNLPGPVDVSCDKPSGSLFPVRTVTTVTCTAVDAVGNTAVDSFTIEVVSPFGYIPDFVVLGEEWATIGNSTTVASGNVGALTSSGGPTHHAGFEVVLNRAAKVAGQVAAESVFVKDQVVAGDIFTVDQLTAHSTATYTAKEGYVPLFVRMPTFPAFTAGTAPTQLAGAGTLAAGTYGKVTVASGSAITLTGGDYYIDALDIGSSATVTAAAPSTLHVVGRTLVRTGALLGTAEGIAARDLTVFVAGVDGPPGAPTAFQAANGATVAANVYAANGTVTLNPATTGTGAFLGKRVLVRNGAVLNLDSHFDVP